MRKLIISNAYIYLVLPRTEVAEADEILRTGHTHAQQTRAHSATQTHTDTRTYGRLGVASMLTIALGIEKFLFNKQQIVNAVVVVVVVYKMKTSLCACVCGRVGAYAYIHLQVYKKRRQSS